MDEALQLVDSKTLDTGVVYLELKRAAIAYSPPHTLGSPASGNLVWAGPLANFTPGHQDTYVNFGLQMTERYRSGSGLPA
jgi:hypothetical protein